MKPEDIRRLYRQEDAATDEEARQSRQEARTDPAQARRLLSVLLALSNEDKEFSMLLSVFLQSALAHLIVERVAENDAFALEMAGLILDGMEQMKPASRVPRGKPTRSA